MSRSIAFGLTLFAALVVGPGLAAETPRSSKEDPGAAPLPVAVPGAFDVETLASGVHLFRPRGGSRTHANSLVVDLEDGLLVVDAQPTPAAARDLLAALEARSGKSVRFLVLTHPHAVSSGGADAFPRSAIRIASRGYRDAVADSGFDYLAALRSVPGIPETLDWERPRAALILFGRTRIEEAGRSVILLPVPEAHSPGDLIVFLPEDGLVAAGGLPFPDRAPYAGSATVSGWLAQLNHLVAMAPRRVVGVRGPAQDVDALRAQRDALQWLIETVEEAVADGVDDEAMSSHVRADPGLTRHLASGNAAHLDLLVGRATAEARDRRRRLGLE